MNFKLILMVAAVLVSFTTMPVMAQGPAQQIPVQPSEKLIKVLSMNVYMLPKPVKNSLQPERIKAIIDQVKKSDYELVFFQEAFMDDFRSAVTSELKGMYPYMHYLDRETFMLNLLGSGVFVLSRYPLQNIDQTYFDKCESYDCFSSKGALFFEVTKPNQSKYQFAVTHLQAAQEDSDIRYKQLGQIKALLKKHEEVDVPQFLVGDLNIDFANAEFGKSIELMQMSFAQIVGEPKTTSSRVNDCYKTGSNKKWIDHAWVANTDHAKLNFTLQVVDFSFEYQGKTCPSSDHHAIEMLFSEKKQAVVQGKK